MQNNNTEKVKKEITGLYLKPNCKKKEKKESHEYSKIKLHLFLNS